MRIFIEAINSVHGGFIFAFVAVLTIVSGLYGIRYFLYFLDRYLFVPTTKKEASPAPEPDQFTHDQRAVFEQLSATDTLADAVLKFKRSQHTTTARDRLWNACVNYQRVRSGRWWCHSTQKETTDESQRSKDNDTTSR